MSLNYFSTLVFVLKQNWCLFVISETREDTEKRLKKSDADRKSISRGFHQQIDTEKEMQLLQEREKATVRNLEKIRLELKAKQNEYQKQTQEQRASFDQYRMW